MDINIDITFEEIFKIKNFWTIFQNLWVPFPEKKGEKNILQK